MGQFEKFQRNLYVNGVILSAAVFQAERRISCETYYVAREIPRPLVKARGFGMTPGELQISN